MVSGILTCPVIQISTGTPVSAFVGLTVFLAATCCACVSFVSLQIELIDGKWHNLPSFPNVIREFNGLAMGTVPHLLEPIWSYLLEFVGDDYYKREREAAAVGKPT